MILIPVFGLVAQDKKPTLMILPSDNWCVQRYFTSEFDNQGTKMKVPNYKQAFQEDTEIGQVISKIGSLMIERGYPLKDAEQEIKAIEARTAEDNMTTSKSTGSSIAESPLDKLKNRTKADIILQIWWKVNKTEQGKIISFTLEAFDSYTSKRIAASTGNGMPSSDIVPVMLQQAVMAQIDLFSSQLLAHFTNMQQNGREITLTIKRFGSWDKDLETEIVGHEITDIITEWLNQNTVNKQYNNSETSENVLRLEQVKIPLQDANKNGVDARQFARNLQKYLKAAPYNIDSKLLNRGLGEAMLILGEK
jgi:exonuclease VII small subunit